MPLMAQRKEPGDGEVEGAERLPRRNYSMVVNTGGKCASVIIDPLPRPPATGACRCGACLAAILAERKVEFE